MVDKKQKVIRLLENYNYNLAVAEYLKAEVEQIRNEITLKGIDYSKVRFQGSGSGLDDVIISRENEIEEKLRRVRVSELEVMKVEGMLKVLSDKDRGIIVRKYFEGRTWREIAVEIDRHVEHTKSLGKKAIMRMSEVI